MRTRVRKSIAVVVSAVLLPFLAVQQSHAGNAPANPSDFAARPPTGRHIVVFKDTTLPPDTIRARSTRLVEAYGGTIVRTYASALAGFTADLDAGQVRRIAADAQVAYVEPDTEAHTAASTQFDPPSWGLDRVDQRGLPLDHAYTYPNTASAVTVYVVDSGIRTSHGQFERRASVGVDEVGDGRAGQDCFGHGTHVAGTIGGRDYGVAKGVHLVSVRVLDCKDSASTSNIIAAADWITAHAVKPAVVNMSINGSRSRSEETAIRNSIASGVTWVVSSGNDGADACRNTPGAITQAIVVNNADSRDRRRGDSDYGSCTDLFAPGTDIKSAWYTGDTATNTRTGTSQAAPHVTGAAALWLSEHPTATPAEVERALIADATVGKIADVRAGTPNRLLHVGPSAASTPPAASTAPTS
ncbi:serine protease [Embleya scabrispora]|uniref:Serine protease n=1 Tax=Embleya scabrispora TaxID=159449 RepID=A0A1T3NK58_9ACTN|nr:S8 family peptidase [Embleya scabrispora]OPC77095.1 serine protease [Embleya scabrispora]